MASQTYRLFAAAMATKQQIVCEYDGYRRELCPIILGHSQGQEKALTFQFSGESSKGLPPGGAWRCLFLAKIGDVRLRDGPWHAGDSHKQPSGCVEEVDLDVNPESPYGPRRRLPNASIPSQRDAVRRAEQAVASIPSPPRKRGSRASAWLAAPGFPLSRE